MSNQNIYLTGTAVSVIIYLLMSPSDATLPNEGDIDFGGFGMTSFSSILCESWLPHTVTLISTSIPLLSSSYDLDITHDTKCMLPGR